MTTLKRRINISANKSTEDILVRIAKRDGVPLATKVAELLRMALEIEEDIALASIADVRSVRKVKFIPHSKAWK